MRWLGCKVSCCTEQFHGTGYNTSSHWNRMTLQRPHISNLISFQGFCLLWRVSVKRMQLCLPSPLPFIFSLHLIFILQPASPDPYGLTPLSLDFLLGYIHRWRWQEVRKWEKMRMLFALPQLPSCQDAMGWQCSHKGHSSCWGSLSFQTPSVGPDLEGLVGVKSLSYSSSWTYCPISE